MDTLKLMQTPKPYAVIYKDFVTKRQLQLRKQTAELCWKYNLTSPLDSCKRRGVLDKLFSSSAKLVVASPFHCDYGFNIHFKSGLVFLNYGVDIIDTSPVYFGNNVRVGPHTCLACTGHSIDYQQRRQGVVISKPILIGDDVWLGANCFVKGGIKIGKHSVIGAGSVVTRDIPSNVVAFGSPCRVHRKINQNDVIKLN